MDPDGAVVAVIRAYFDNSGTQDDQQHNWLTLGGYLTTETHWEKFEADWAKNLADFQLPYLHMRYFAHHLPPFERFKNDEQGRVEFLTNCINIIKAAKPRAFCHSIQLRDMDRFNSEFGRKIDAFSFCLYLTYIDIREAYGANNRVELILDKIEKPNLRIHRANEYARTDTFYGAKYGDVSSTIDPRPLKAPDSFINILPIQAADFLVWELRKSSENLNEWHVARDPQLPISEWINDLARWNLAKHGAPFRERRSLLALDQAVSSEGFSVVYQTLVLAEKFHPNGWGVSS